MSSIATAILGLDGPIARALGPDYEPREQQLRMADAVAAAMEQKAKLLVEAVAAAHGAEGAVTLRLSKAGGPVVTDGGHLLLVALFGRISEPEALSADLHNVPGVVEHGLFLGLCSKAYVAGPNGIETIDL